ncbi:Bug family tripartite tricarboxylate transporter substrate binding protein [Ramlibacter sp.]|uniref:Bug family tripartite tricarboxylate transporter substrate binding protein n=1 Tax=Ramlibacter sp. TaxID=1917967 RepID=UPI003D0BBCBE
MRIFRALAAAACIAALLAPPAALAQAFPSKPINFIVQYAAGSGADQLARVIADATSKGTGANFVIRNTPGALGSIGTTALVRSPADGYTVGICSASINSIANSVSKSLPYDTVTDFTFIEPLAAYTYVVTAAPGLGFDSLDALVRQAAAKPDSLSYVYANATAQVLSATLAKQLDMRVLPVPYKSSAEGLADVSQSRVSYGVTDVGTTVPMVKSGRVKALAVISTQRSINLPDVPALTELGRAPIQVVAWAGLCGPKNMAPESVAWLRAQVRKARGEAETLEKFKLLGLDPLDLGGQTFPDFVSGQLRLWTAAARDAGIKAE